MGTLSLLVLLLLLPLAVIWELFDIAASGHSSCATEIKERKELTMHLCQLDNDDELCMT